MTATSHLKIVFPLLLKTKFNYSIFQISYFLFFASLPFIYSESIIDPVLIPRQLFLSLFLAFIWAALLLKKGLRDYSFQISNLSLLIILCNTLLVVLSFISIIYANTISESIYVASKYAIIFLFFITTYFLLNNQLISRRDLINDVIVFCIVSLSYGAYDIVLLLTNNLKVLSNAHLITATYANKNLFASILLLCFWATFANNSNRLLKYILIVLLLVFVLLIQSKIVAIAFVFMLLMLAIKSLKLNTTKNKLKIIIGCFIGLIALFVVLLNFGKFENLSNLNTLNTRYSLWENSFNMFRETPFGVGVGNWQIFFPKYGLSHFDLSEVRNGMILYQRPHNDFIWMLCELGLQGLILYLLIFSIVIIMLVRLNREKDNLMPFLLLINLLGYCMVAFFDFPLERIEHQVLLSVIILLSMSYYDAISIKKKAIRPLKYSPIYGLLICASLVVCCFRLKGEYFTREFIILNKTQNAAFVIANCNKAKSLFYSIDPIATPIAWHEGVSLFGVNKIEEAKLQFEIAYKYMPYNVHVLNNLGTVYEKEGNHIKAVEYYKMALKISPSATVVTLK